MDVEGIEPAEATGFQVEFLKDGEVVSIATRKTFVTGALGARYTCEADITAPPFDSINPYFELRFTLLDEDGEILGEESQLVFVSP